MPELKLFLEVLFYDVFLFIIVIDIVHVCFNVQVLQKAADRALAKLDNYVVLDDGLEVDIARTVGNPYTLILEPEGDYSNTMEIDMVPAFEIPISILPDSTMNRVLQIQEKVGFVEENCLAVALPVVNQDLFQVTMAIILSEPYEELYPYCIELYSVYRLISPRWPER